MFVSMKHSTVKFADVIVTILTVILILFILYHGFQAFIAPGL